MASAPRSPPPPEQLPADPLGTGRQLALGAGGAALLVVVAARYRLDRTLCAAWPSFATGYAYGAVYLTGIALLAWAWRRGRSAPVALAVNALALGAAPFLSSDPLMYVAVGRALAGGAGAASPVGLALGPHHPFLVALPPAWRLGGSAYGPAWNALARLVGHLAGDHLDLALRLHQLLALAAVLLAAWIVSETLEGSRRAFCLVALCPLAIVEGTVGAHNDALLMPFVAAALWAWRRRHACWAYLLLALGLAVKASAVLVLGPALLAALLYRLPTRRARVLMLAMTGIVALASLAAMTLLHDGPLDALARIVGSPARDDHCTRSVECLPRVLLRFVAHAPMGAWVTGLVFRVLGIAWLCWTALRTAEAARDVEAPRMLAPTLLVRGLFLYLLLLHGWAQSWYALPLVPMVPFLVEDRRWAPALRLYLVTAVAYYALVLPYSCLSNDTTIAISDAVEAALTLFPPLGILLLRSDRPRG